MEKKNLKKNEVAMGYVRPEAKVVKMELEMPILGASGGVTPSTSTPNATVSNFNVVKL